MTRKALIWMMVFISLVLVWAFTLVPLFAPVAGKQIVSPKDAPWTVALTSYAPRGTVLCSGSHIAPAWILTAAHCVQDQRPILAQSAARIKAQDDDLKIRELDPSREKSLQDQAAWSKQVIPYPGAEDYDWGAGMKKPVVDLALIQLEKPLASPQIQIGDLQDSMPKTFASWGFGPLAGAKKYSLYRSPAKVQVCQDKGLQWYCATANQNNDTQVCEGDSGGPLTVSVGSQIRLIGVSSFGTAIPDPLDSCIPRGVGRWIGPQVFFAQAADHIGWIQNTLKNNQ